MIKRLVEKVAECDSEQEMAENQKVGDPLRGMIQSIAEETESDYLMVSDAYHQILFYELQDVGVDKKEADL